MDHLDRARRSYAKRAWADAFQAFSDADRESPLEAHDLELLALAAYLIGRDEEYLSTLERAYHAHLESDDTLRAIRCAFWLGFRVLMRGEMGRANGWFAHARRLLEHDARDCAERGYLLLPTVGQGPDFKDSEAAHVAAAEAAAIAQRCGDLELLACARMEQGRIRLQQGQVHAASRTLTRLWSPSFLESSHPSSRAYCIAASFRPVSRSMLSIGAANGPPP